MIEKNEDNLVDHRDPRLLQQESHRSRASRKDLKRSSAPHERDSSMIEVDEIECDIDADVDDEHYSSKNINDSFINKLRDISTFNPSGIKGKEKVNYSMTIIPMSSINNKINDRGSTTSQMNNNHRFTDVNN